MLNDRGTKKWTAIMLPEHVDLLKEVFSEGERKERPILDDQKKMELSFMLQTAIKDDLTVQIKYYKDYDYQTTKGKLLFIDSLGGLLRLDDGTEIKVTDILDVFID